MAKDIFSEDESQAIKRKFNQDLEPIKTMLAHRKGDLQLKEWLDFVARTKLSVLKHPDQYLSKEIPSEPLFTRIVNQIFEEFIQDEVSQQDLKNI